MSQLQRRLALSAIVSLAVVALLLAGLNLWLNRPPADPLAAYRPALRAGFRMGPEQVAALPTYSITVRIDPEPRAFTGTVQVTIPITGMDVRELYFRLYPNLPQFDGDLKVSVARVNGKTVNFGYTADDTAVHLTLPEPIPAGETAVAELGFFGEAPLHEDYEYTIFGAGHGILSLTNFYPILALQRNNGCPPSASCDRSDPLGPFWAVDVADPQGDVGTHDAALYQVDVTTRADQVIAATGSAITSTMLAGDWKLTRYVLGPAREFSLALSPAFEVLEAEAYSTTVRSYFLPEHTAAGRAALQTGVTSLQIYSDEFGPYPYSEMAVVEAPLTFHGMEFPGMSLIGTDTYGEQIDSLENLVSHEVAHQWWYNQVGNDQVNAPWLDEGLAEFSMYVYTGGRYGYSVADLFRHTRWAAPVQYHRSSGTDMPIGLRVTDYEGNYEAMVYAKGALFFAALRDEMGVADFEQFLRSYLHRYRWQIAAPGDLQAVAEEVSGQDLGDLFGEWLLGES